jgi:hypothetical protein
MFAAEMLAMLRVNPPSRTDEITTAVFPSAFNLRAKHLSTKPLDKANWEVEGALGFNVLLARDLGRFATNEADDKKLVEDIFVLAKDVHTQIEEQREYMDRASFWVHEFMTTITSLWTAAASQSQS